MSMVDFIKTLEKESVNFPIVKRSGLSSNQIQDIEVKLGIQLPDDLKEFYSFTNGLEGEDHIFNIIPLNEVEKRIDSNGEYLVFAEYMIYSDTFGLELDSTDKNRYRIFTWTNEDEQSQARRKYKADSLIDFITQYCSKGTIDLFHN